MGCRNSAEQIKRQPQATYRGSSQTHSIQTTRPSLSSPITLHYFDIYGRAEAIRMVLAYLDLSYIDHRVEFSEWPSLKQSPMCEFEQLPVLDIDGHLLVQSRAALRYLCQIHSLYPTSAKDIYLLESLCDEIEDLRTPLLELTFKKDLEGLNKRYNNDVAKMLPNLQSRLIRNGSKAGLFVGGKATMADFAVFEFLWDYFLMAGKRESRGVAVERFPKLLAFAEKMQRLSPSLETYLSERPMKWL